MESTEDRYFRLLREDTMDIDAEAAEQGSVYSQDIGFVNQQSGAGMIARDSGALEGYASNNLGFRFDPESESLTIVANNIVLLTEKIVQRQEPKDFIGESKEQILFLAKGQK